MRKHRAQNGFTILEVLIALIIFIIAVMGLSNLQRASVAGTDRGRQHTAAVNIARYFLNELKVEISNWTPFDPGTANNCAPTTAMQNDLPLLSNGLEANCAGAWTLLDANTSRVDEFLGHEDMTDNDVNSHYCVHYWVSPIPPGNGADRGPYALIWQIRVRVAWAKPGQYTAWQNCDPALFATGGARAISTDVIELTGFATRELSQ